MNLTIVSLNMVYYKTIQQYTVEYRGISPLNHAQSSIIPILAQEKIE